MKTRDPEAILERMKSNYSKQCNGLRGANLFNFHREHLVIFIRRFLGVSNIVKAPLSDWLSHDLFLTIEAVTNIVLRDFRQTPTSDLDEETMVWLKEYFKQFDLLRSGSIGLNEGLAGCLSVLKVTQHEID